MRLCIGLNWPFSISAKDLCSVDFARKHETSFWMETTRSLRNCKQKSQHYVRDDNQCSWKQQLNTNSKVQGTQLSISTYLPSDKPWTTHAGEWNQGCRVTVTRSDEPRTGLEWSDEYWFAYINRSRRNFNRRLDHKVSCEHAWGVLWKEIKIVCLPPPLPPRSSEYRITGSVEKFIVPTDSYNCSYWLIQLFLLHTIVPTEPGLVFEGSMRSIWYDQPLSIRIWGRILPIPSTSSEQPTNGKHFESRSRKTRRRCKSQSSRRNQNQIWEQDVVFECGDWIWQLNLKVNIECEDWMWKLNVKIDCEDWMWKLNVKIECENWMWRLNVKIYFSSCQLDPFLLARPPPPTSALRAWNDMTISILFSIIEYFNEID